MTAKPVKVPDAGSVGVFNTVREAEAWLRAKERV
jgi:hypothetical protein